MQLPSESDMSSSCSDSLEFTFSDFTMEGEITDKRGHRFTNTMGFFKMLETEEHREDKWPPNIRACGCRVPAAGGLWMISESV